MNVWKKALAGMAALALCTAMMVGCAGTKEKVDAGVTASPEGMQPGAKVENYITPEGNKGYSYTNPDGSGGGGVELT